MRNFQHGCIDRNLAIVLILYLCFSFFMITKFPRVWLDTSWTTIAPYTLVTEGRLANPILRGWGYGLNEHFLAPEILQRVLLAGVYKIFGFGLVQSRALSILAGFFLILIAYCFTKEYFDGTIATLAVVLLACDNVFFVTSRTIRPDIFVALFAAGSYFFLLHGLETNSLRFFIISGILMGVSFYTHPNSFLVLIAIVLIFFFKYRLSFLSCREFWAFSLSCLIGFAPYASYVIREDLANSFSHFKAQIGGESALGDRNLLEAFLGEHARYANYIYFPKRIFILLVQVASILYAIVSRRRIDKYLVFMIAIFLLLLPLWNPYNLTSRYFIVLIPAVCILVSALFVDAFRAISQSRYKIPGFCQELKLGIMTLIFILFFLNQFGGDIYILWKHKDHDFYSFISEVKRTIPEGSKVWGSLTFWIGLSNYPYLPQVSSYEEVEEFKPEYAILYDSETWGDVSATVGRKANTAQAFGDLPKKVEELCHEKGYFLKRIDDKFYGNIEIYKIIW